MIYMFIKFLPDLPEAILSRVNQRWSAAETRLTSLESRVDVLSTQSTTTSKSSLIQAMHMKNLNFVAGSSSNFQ